MATTETPNHEPQNQLVHSAPAYPQGPTETGRPMSSHGPIESAYYAQMNDIGKLLDDALNDKQPKKTGFVLLVFDFGEPTPSSRMNYISNASHQDMLVALHELLANFEGRMMPDAKGQ